jgi:uncharacterized short protein YbdD (DUF466 family)
MKTESIMDRKKLETITSFARRNYKTYVQHYKSRNLTPMSLEEFLKNYQTY